MSFLIDSLALLRDAVLALLWTDLRAAARLRARLEARDAAQERSPQEAQRMAALRLLAAVGAATLFVPWLALGLAWGGRMAAHGGVPERVGTLLGLAAWLLAWAYGRGVLQWWREEAWRKAVYRLCGQDAQGDASEPQDWLREPRTSGGVTLRRWRVARLWAGATALTLLGLVWLLVSGTDLPRVGSVAGSEILLGASLMLSLAMVQRYNKLLAEVFDLTLRRTTGRAWDGQDARCPRG